MTPLRQKMLAEMSIRNLAPATQYAYVHQVEAFARYFKRSPALLGTEEIRRYQLHLIHDKHVAWSTFNQFICALRFFYSHTLGRRGPLVRLRFAKRPKKLPVVLSPEEVDRLFRAVRSLKHRTILMVAYGAGLRVSEVTHLKVSDVDSQRSTLRVRDGKGQKDRDVMLSPRLLASLRQYWKAVRPQGDFFFPGARPHRPITRVAVFHACQAAAKAAGITKRVGPHTLRHSFATHLVEAGTDVRMVQALMGHRSLHTTSVYFHVSRPVTAVVSPLDRLPSLLSRSSST